MGKLADDGPDYTKMDRSDLLEYVCTQNRIIRSLLRELAERPAKKSTTVQERKESREKMRNSYSRA